MTNALSYVVRRQIPFYDHPGTPGILILAASYTPLRLWAKYAVSTPFIDWSINHFTFLMFYSRFIALITCFLGVLIYLQAIFRYTASRLAVFLAWLGLFAFSQFLRNGVRPTPENFLYLSTAIWLWFFLAFIKRQKVSHLIFLNLAAGFALATKLTSLPLVIITLICSAWFLFPKIKLWIFVSGLTGVSFILSTWPIRTYYILLFGWATTLVTRLEVSTKGTVGVFSLDRTLNGLAASNQQEPIMTLYFWLALLIFIAAFKKLPRLSGFLFALAIGLIELFFFSYAKFSRPHYALLNYLVLNSLLTILLARSRHALLVFTLLLIPVSLNQILSHARWSVPLARLARVEDFIASHPPKHKTLWYIADTKDFALLWGRVWSGEFYGPQLDKYYPRIGEIVNPQTYRDNSTRTYPIFSVCWDQLYLRDSELGEFLHQHRDRKLTVQSVPFTRELFLVTSYHCF